MLFCRWYSVMGTQGVFMFLQPRTIIYIIIAPWEPNRHWFSDVYCACLNSRCEFADSHNTCFYIKYKLLVYCRIKMRKSGFNKRIYYGSRLLIFCTSTAVHFFQLSFMIYSWSFRSVAKSWLFLRREAEYSVSFTFPASTFLHSWQTEPSRPAVRCWVSFRADISGVSHRALLACGSFIFPPAKT